MRILVTGASSALMGGVVRALVTRGDEVRCLQRRHVDHLDHLEGVQKHVHQHLGDIRDAAAVGEAIAGCDAVIHGAALVGVVGTWEQFKSVNVDGTRVVIDAARRAGVARVVHVSTPSVAHIGDSLVGEPAGTAQTGRRHREYYSESKALAEIDALDAADEELGVVAIRPHLVWGPGDRQLVGRIVERARRGRLPLVGGGVALVDTTYLDNAVDALVAALDAVGPGATVSGRAYVVANGEPRPIRDLVAGICLAVGVEPAMRTLPIRPARAAGSLIERVWPRLASSEPPLTRFVVDQLATAHWFDLSETFRDLCWQPRISLDEGLASLARAGR